MEINWAEALKNAIKMGNLSLIEECLDHKAIQFLTVEDRILCAQLIVSHNRPDILREIGTEGFLFEEALHRFIYDSIMLERLELIEVLVKENANRDHFHEILRGILVIGSEEALNIVVEYIPLNIIHETLEVFKIESYRNQTVIKCEEMYYVKKEHETLTQELSHLGAQSIKVRL